MLALSAWLLKHALVCFKYSDPSHWRETTGIITESRAIDWKGSSSFAVKYTYEVNGKKYAGYRDALYTIASKEDVKSLVEKYKEGHPATIFYLKQTPSESCLIIGTNPKKKYSDIILTILGLIIGFSLCLWSLFHT